MPKEDIAYKTRTGFERGASKSFALAGRVVKCWKQVHFFVTQTIRLFWDIICVAYLAASDYLQISSKFVKEPEIKFKSSLNMSLVWDIHQEKDTSDQRWSCAKEQQNILWVTLDSVAEYSPNWQDVVQNCKFVSNSWTSETKPPPILNLVSNECTNWAYTHIYQKKLMV